MTSFFLVCLVVFLHSNCLCFNVRYRKLQNKMFARRKGVPETINEPIPIKSAIPKKRRGTAALTRETEFTDMGQSLAELEELIEAIENDHGIGESSKRSRGRSNERTNHDQKDILNGVVRIYCTHAVPNFGMPWQRQRQEFSTSTGFAIDGRRILTNAHAVEYGSLIQVKKRGSENKYVASVAAVGHECDLAILTVEDESFWNGGGLSPLSFGDIPDLQDDVSVIGFPVGGDSISISSGVVSRIEMQEYAQASAQLLAIQIDAAINPGNSGGPVVNTRNEVIGVAFQSLNGDDTENIGYVVPVNVINHFIEDVDRHGSYSGVCGLGIKLQGMENADMRRYFGMDDVVFPVEGKSRTSSTSSTGKVAVRETDAAPEALSGVRVLSIAPLAPASALKLLHKGDVIVAVDGIRVANDGTIPFHGTSSVLTSRNGSTRNGSGGGTGRPGKLIKGGSAVSDTSRNSQDDDSVGGRFMSRVHLSYYFTQKFAEDKVRIQLLRDRKLCEVEVPLWIPQRLVPRALLHKNHVNTTTNVGTGSNGSIVGGSPSYLLIGGIVFIALSQEYLAAEYNTENLGTEFERWAEEFRTLSLADGTKNEPDEEVVFMSQVISHSCNIGYETMQNMRLKSVNGISVSSLRHLKDLVDAMPYATQQNSLSSRDHAIERDSIAETAGGKKIKGSKGVTAKGVDVAAYSSTGLLHIISNLDAEAMASSSANVSEAIVFEFTTGQIIVMDGPAALASQDQICKEHFIAYPCSEDLR